MSTILTVLFTFVLTSIVGTWIVHAWQRHNWIVQRRILEAEEQIKALQKTFDEVSELAGKRQHRMFRLLSAIRQGTDDTLTKRLADYDEASLTWNEKLSTIYAKLAYQLRYPFSLRLEADIQKRFVKLDNELTGLIAARRNGATISTAGTAPTSKELVALHTAIVRFNKDTLLEIERQKQILYEPELNAKTLHRFPTWQLFKALFKPRKHSLDEL